MIDSYLFLGCCFYLFLLAAKYCANYSRFGEGHILNYDC